MLGSVLSTEKTGIINPWQRLFTEPIEIVYIIMKDGVGFKHTSRYETKIHLNIGMLERKLKKIKKRNYSIKEIMIVIHNHLRNSEFSPEDHRQYMRLKEHGFNGSFLLYSHMTNKTYNIENKVN